MAISSLSDLKTAIADWLARSDIDTDRVEDFIVLAEAEINRRLRVRQQEATTDLTVNGQSVSLPSGFLGVRRIYLSANPLIKPEYMAPEVFWATFVQNNTGRPHAYTIEGDNIIFGPTPDATYTGKLLYWERKDITSSVHTLFTQNPDLYLYGALMQSAPYIGDDARVALWEREFERIIASVEASNERDRYATGMAVRATGTTP